MNKFYNEIDNAILRYEHFTPYHDKSIEWICNRIEWCWKWKHITQQQMEELCDRICIVMKNN